MLTQNFGVRLGGSHWTAEWCWGFPKGVGQISSLSAKGSGADTLANGIEKVHCGVDKGNHSRLGYFKEYYHGLFYWF